MYEERKDRFSIRDLIIQILIIALVVFLLMWLFPTKGDLSKLNFGSSDTNRKENTNTVLYDRIFNENIIAMKDAAKSYYTTPRLPKNVGDKVSMTLGEMLEKKILLPFTDKNGKQCDNTASYVEITKESDEFIMKVNLKCSSEENYLLVYMGCYDYCSTTICEKNKEDVKSPVIKRTNPSKSTSSSSSQTIVNNITNITNNIITIVCPECCPTPTPTPTPPTNTPTPTPTPPPTDNPDKEYVCEYIKTTNAKYSEWSSWSKYSPAVQYTTPLQQVKTKVQRTTVTKKVLTGYNVITYKDSNKPIYKKVQVQTGTKTEKKCASYGTKTENDGTTHYSGWTDQGLVKLYNVPSDTDTVRYVYVSRGVDNCTNCTYTNYYIYRKYTRNTTPGTHQVTYCTGYTTVETPLYTTVNVITGYGTSERKEPVYENRKTVEDVKYYSTRTRRIISGSKDVKWDVCEGSSLINDGYSFTGNKKEK